MATKKEILFFGLIHCVSIETAVQSKTLSDLGSSNGEKEGKGNEGAAITRGRRQIVIMLGTVVFFFFACLLPFKGKHECPRMV